MEKVDKYLKQVAGLDYGPTNLQMQVVFKLQNTIDRNVHAKYMDTNIRMIEHSTVNKSLKTKIISGKTSFSWKPGKWFGNLINLLTNTGTPGFGFGKQFLLIHF